jgi:hypothetical protein
MFSFGMVSVILLLYLDKIGITTDLGLLLAFTVIGDVLITLFLTTRCVCLCICVLFLLLLFLFIIVIIELIDLEEEKR